MPASPEIITHKNLKMKKIVNLGLLVLAFAAVVAPAFGQAGGGVEICLTNDEKVKFMGVLVLPIY